MRLNRCEVFRLLCGLTLVANSPLAAQAPGDTAPTFTLKTLEGNAISLAQFKGHPVVLNFWGSWCPPCREEMPLLVAAYAVQRDSGLVILAVDGRDQEFSAADVRAFAAEFRISFPVLLDERGEVRIRYQLRGLPTTVFVGSDGIVRAVNIGPLTAASLELHLREILAGAPGRQ